LSRLSAARTTVTIQSGVWGLQKTSKHTPLRGHHSWSALLRETFVAWWNDNALRLGASLAFYSVFSIAPCLIFAVLIVGLVYGNDAAAGRIAEQLQGVMGPDAARGVQSLIATAHRTSSGSRATMLSVLALFVGASSAFSELQSALNMIWKVQPKPSARWWISLRNRALTYVMVLFSGLLILGLLILSSAATVVWQSVNGGLPLASTGVHALNFGTTLLVETLMFAMIFKLLPDVRIAWRDVWLGALVTAVLFATGNMLIGLYLRSSAIESAYGAAGSLAVFLLWTYYSALIIYLGAEFTHTYVGMFGSRAVGDRRADASATPARRDK
jgi:membrane protein